jgi:propanol-preferring alcohol dehydrogenase
MLALPPDMDPALAAPLGCSGTTAYRSVAVLGNPGEGDVVVILGAGGVGLSAVQIAKAQGARVVAVDTKEEARKAALEAGADSAMSPEEAGEVRDADVVVDFVGRRTTLELGRSLLGVGGRFVSVAGGSEPISMTANDIMEGGRAYLGSFSTTIADLARVIALAEAGKLRLVITRRASLEEAEEVLADLAAGKIVGRAVLSP